MLNGRSDGQADGRSLGQAYERPMVLDRPGNEPSDRPTVQPSALLPVYAQFPLRPVRGRGSWLTDENGDEWLDAYGGHAVAATGHSHPHVVQAVQEQAERLLFYSSAVPHEQRER